MKACHSCGEPLHHPHTGHTLICPSCGTLFDFENPQNPLIDLAPATLLPQAPLKSRARWIALLALFLIFGLFYVSLQMQAENLKTTEQTP